MKDWRINIIGRCSFREVVGVVFSVGGSLLPFGLKELVWSSSGVCVDLLVVCDWFVGT